MNSESKLKKSIAVTVRLPPEIVDEIDAKSNDRAEFIRNIILEVRRSDYKVNSTEIKKETGEIKPAIEGATAEFKEGQISATTEEVNQNTTANVETAPAEIVNPKKADELQNLKDRITILTDKIDMLTNNQQIMTQYMTAMQQLLQQKKIAGEVDDDVKKPWWKFW